MRFFMSYYSMFFDRWKVFVHLKVLTWTRINQWGIHTYSLRQCFEKLSLNAASCQAADIIESVHTALGPEFKDIKDF